MQKLAERNRAKVIDLLAERLACERSSVRLHDRLLERVKAAADPIFAAMLDDLNEQRNQEQEHAEWIASQIRALGGDAAGETERSRLATTESKGLEEVMREGEIPHLLHALLAAELVDSAGWELLVELADEVDDGEARWELKRRLRQELEHLARVRRAVQRLSRSEVLGVPAAMP